MGHTRQELDEMADHDLLIEHTIEIRTLCELMRGSTSQIADFTRKFERQLDTYLTRMDQKCAGTHDKLTETHREIFAKVDKKTDNLTFRWIVGILVAAMLTMVGAVGAERLGINANKRDIMGIEAEIVGIRGLLKQNGGGI